MELLGFVVLLRLLRVKELHQSDHGFVVGLHVVLLESVSTAKVAFNAMCGPILCCIPPICCEAVLNEMLSNEDWIAVGTNESFSGTIAFWIAEFKLHVEGCEVRREKEERK